MKKYKNKDWLYQKYWGEKLSTYEIASLLGVNGRTIWEWMKKFNIRRRTSSEIGRRQTGNRHPYWKGGRRNDSGYIAIYQPNHPHAQSHGYVLEHRLVMERKLGRYLESYEIVHHIDGNKKNNNDENLFLTTRKIHTGGYLDGYKQGFATASLLFLMIKKKKGKK